jgi:NAD+ kinase
MSALRSVGMLPHRDRPAARALARQVADTLRERGVAVRVPEADADGLDDLAGPDTDFARDLDLVLSFGGDGTMLRAVDLVYAAGVPVLGVNVGLLGYLTEVEPHDLDLSLERYFGGDYEVEDRMMLDIDVCRSGVPTTPAPYRALNEAVVEKDEAGHTIRLLVHIEGAPFMSYAADGLIAATPTGSTAYSLSARGPVVSPRHRALLLTPVSPHMLFDRSLVLAPDQPAAIEVLGHRRAALSVDGRRITTLDAGDVVVCRPSPHVARLVRFSRRHFHQLLKAKFALADR